MKKLATLILATAITNTAFSDISQKTGEALCAEMSNTINTIVDFTKTICFPAAGKDKNTYSFMLASEQPVMQIPDAKKAWVLIAVSAAGYSLNQHPQIKTDEIMLTDAMMTKMHKVQTIPAKLAKELQAKMSTDQMTPDAAYSQISANLKEKDLLP